MSTVAQLKYALFKSGDGNFTTSGLAGVRHPVFSVQQRPLGTLELLPPYLLSVPTLIYNGTQIFMSSLRNRNLFEITRVVLHWLIDPDVSGKLHHVVTGQRYLSMRSDPTIPKDNDSEHMGYEKLLKEHIRRVFVQPQDELKYFTISQCEIMQELSI